MSFGSGLKTIVVATDLEGRSEAALEYARKLASAYGARIILAHGTDPMEYAVVDGVPGRIWQNLSDQARAVLDELAADLLREGIHSHSEIRQGAVVEMLIQVARSNRNREVRKQAMFWLGQSNDPRALEFFEEVLKP